jgi:hypothetical protein
VTYRLERQRRTKRHAHFKVLPSRTTSKVTIQERPPVFCPTSGDFNTWMTTRRPFSGPPNSLRGAKQWVYEDDIDTTFASCRHRRPGGGFRIFASTACTRPFGPWLRCSTNHASALGAGHHSRPPRRWNAYPWHHSSGGRATPRFSDAVEGDHSDTDHAHSVVDTAVRGNAGSSLRSSQKESAAIAGRARGAVG